MSRVPSTFPLTIGVFGLLYPSCGAPEPDSGGTEITVSFFRAHSPSPRQLAANRANARLSTGPRTREGRRRSALNRLGVEISDLTPGRILRPEEARDFLRIWRDLVALFWFVEPPVRRTGRRSGRRSEGRSEGYSEGGSEGRDRASWWHEEPKLEFLLNRAAWAWWGKLPAARSGLGGFAGKDAEIESRLSEFLFEFSLCNRKCDYWLRKEFGADGRRDLRTLRESVESRLTAFRHLPSCGASGQVRKTPVGTSAPAGAEIEKDSVKKEILMKKEIL
jgi:hypothetical protein